MTSILNNVFLPTCFKGLLVSGQRQNEGGISPEEVNSSLLTKIELKTEIEELPGNEARPGFFFFFF